MAENWAQIYGEIEEIIIGSFHPKWNILSPPV
jgi:hypothetical protein